MSRMSSFGPLSGPVAPPSAHPSPTLDYKRPGSTSVRQPIVPWVTDWIVAHRRLIFALSLIPMIISFNGRWRVGLDSSIYRGLARSIAAGNGYHFGQFGTHQVYPGLPVLLAGVTKLFGENVFRPLVPILLMIAMSIVSLRLVYRIIGKHYPKWMAVCVTAGMAFNFWFVKLSQEVLTDIPFLLGLMIALLGWDLLRTGGSDRHRTKAAIIMSIGLAIAAVMRPTFWILCLALLVTWTFGLVRGFFTGAWKFYLMCLGIMTLLFLAFCAIDPRTAPDDPRSAKTVWFMRPFSGGYEVEMIEALQEGKAPQTDAENAGQSLRSRVTRGVRQLLAEHLPASFLGQQLPGTAGVILSVVVIGSAVIVARKQPVWALFIVFSACVTVVLSTAPRYYVMILPFLLLGYLLTLRKLGEKLGGGWCDLVLLAGLLFFVIMNIAKLVPFVIEQQRVPFYEAGMRYYDTYRGGKFAPIIHLAEKVRELVPPGARVVTPSAQVVRYLSDREVLMERELLPAKKTPRHYPEHLASMQIAYAAFPAKIYLDKEPTIANLIRHGVIVPGRRLGSVDGIRLAEANVQVRPGDWQKLSAPTPATKPTTKKAKSTTKPATQSAAAKARADAKKRAELKAAKLRKEKKLAAATQPTTKSAKKKKKKHPATAATQSTPLAH